MFTNFNNYNIIRVNQCHFFLSHESLRVLGICLYNRGDSLVVQVKFSVEFYVIVIDVLLDVFIEIMYDV